MVLLVRQRFPSRPCNDRLGFTLVELLVVISIIGILISLLLPALQMSREIAGRTLDASNQHQWAVACLTYSNDFEEYLPQGRRTSTDGNPNSDDYVWFRLETWEILRDTYGVDERASYCQSVGRYDWMFEPRPFALNDTLVGWIYWGGRDNRGANVAYQSPGRVNDHATSDTLLTCWAYDAFTPGFPWRSWAPHVGAEARIYPAGTAYSPEPDGLSVGYRDGSAQWV